MSVVQPPPGEPVQPSPPRWLQRLQAPSGVIDTGPAVRRWQRTAGWAAEWMARSAHLVARYTSAIGKGASEPLLLVSPLPPSGTERAAGSLPGDGAVRAPDAADDAPAVAAARPSAGPATPASALLQRWQRRTDTLQTLQRRPASALLGASASAGVVDPALHQRLLARAGAAPGAAVTADAPALPVVSAFQAQLASTGPGGPSAEAAPGVLSGLGALASTLSRSPKPAMSQAPSVRPQRPGDTRQHKSVQRMAAPSQAAVGATGSFSDPGARPVVAAADPRSVATVMETVAAIHGPALLPSPAADALVPSQPRVEPAPGAAALSHASALRPPARSMDALVTTGPSTRVLARQVETDVPTAPTPDPAHGAPAPRRQELLARAAIAVDAAAPTTPRSFQPFMHQASPTARGPSPAMAPQGAIDTAATPQVDPPAGQRGPFGQARAAPWPAQDLPLQHEAGPRVARRADAGAILASPAAALTSSSEARPAAGATGSLAALASGPPAPAPGLARSAEAHLGAAQPPATLVWQRPTPASVSGPGSSAASPHLMRSSPGSDRAADAGSPSSLDAGPGNTVQPAPGPDLADLAERVTRLIARRLDIERERRGGPR